MGFKGSPAGWYRRRVSSPGQVKSTGQTGPRIRSHLAEGRGNVDRIGARAFSTSEGYAGRNRRNGVGLNRLIAGKRAATVAVLV
jgi:hypothetical protein